MQETTICRTCLGPVEHPPRGRKRIYCSELCKNTGKSRIRRGNQPSNPGLIPSDLVTERNELVLKLRTLEPQLEAAHKKLAKRANESRRHKYTADTADTKADTKIGHHGAVIVTARQHAEDAEQVAMGFIAEADRLRDENARLRDRLRESLATVESRGTPPPAKPKVQRTLATQVYFAFHQLAKDYRELRRGTDLDDSDYRLFDHAARNRARLKLNGTDIDQRTLYYFTRLTTAAYQRGKQQNHQDANTANNIKLYNIVSKLVAIPKGIRPFGETTRIPEPTTSQPE